MRFFWIIVFTLFVHADQHGIAYQQKLYDSLFHQLFAKSTINVYTDTINESLFLEENHFFVVSKCEDADIVFLSSDSQLQSCSNKPIFVTNYDEFKHRKNVIGAFYYRKGRPQLKLNQHYLDHFKLSINTSLTKYIE